MTDGESVPLDSERPGSSRMTRRRFVQYGAGLAAAAGLDLSRANAAFAQGPPQGRTSSVALFDMQYLYEMDLSDATQAASAYDQMQLVAALQGIVNRDAPRLYVNFSQPNPYFDGYPDEYWLAQLQRSGGMLAGRSVVPVADLDSLIKMFRPFVRGSVVWDPKVWSTANVATTVAGVEDVLPIRYDPSPGSLYSRYVAPTVPPGSPPAPPSGHVPPGTPPALPPGPPPSVPPTTHTMPRRPSILPPGIPPKDSAQHSMSHQTSRSAPPGRPPAAGDRLPALVWLVGRGGSSLFTGSGVIHGTGLASSGSAKCDAYLWAKAKYLDTRRCDPSQLAYILDAYWLVDPTVIGVACNCMLRDSLVSRRAFVFDLSPWSDEEPPDSPHEPLGTDVKTLEAILLSAYNGTGGQMTTVVGFIPFEYKYSTLSRPVAGAHGPVPGEWQTAQILSAYNAYLAVAGLGGVSDMANASVFAHVPVGGHHPLPPPPTLAELRARGLVNPDGSVVPKRYSMFYLGDFDNAPWMYNALPGLWNDPERGATPLNWAFDPELSNWIAPAFLYTRATATANDFFIAGDSGAGYLNPSGLEAPRAISGLPSGLAAWQRHCSRYYQLWDISITGFVIEGNNPAMSARGRQSYAQFSYNGFAEQYTSELGIVGTTPLPSDAGWRRWHARPSGRSDRGDALRRHLAGSLRARVAQRPGSAPDADVVPAGLRADAGRLPECRGRLPRRVHLLRLDPPVPRGPGDRDGKRVTARRGSRAQRAGAPGAGQLPGPSHVRHSCHHGAVGVGREPELGPLLAPG